MSGISNIIGQDNSLQVSSWGDIDASSEAFTLTNNNAFLIKNENDVNVTIDVIPATQKLDTPVSTVFYPGWNVELVREVAITAETGLKWGR